MRIGIYGGAFNPPHPGHIRLAEMAKELLGLDMVLLVPTGDPPHKALPEGSPSPLLRLEMISVAARGRDGILVSDMEINRHGKSYTADTVQEVADSNPGAELFLIMGTDMFLSFDKWYQPEKICRLCTLATSYRSEGDIKKAGSIEAQRIDLTKTMGAKTQLIPVDFIEASSTAARIMLTYGCADGYLDDEVVAYIKENNLYNTSRELKSLDIDTLRKIALTLIAETRVPHVLGCEQAAESLAGRWGANVTDAKRAAILHDVTKALSLREQLILCKKYDIITDMLERSQSSLLHSKTGAAVAEFVFGENPQVCAAIRTHTTGSGDMSLLQRIIYLADYIEPNRKLDGIDELRRLSYEDIDKAMLLGMNMTIESLVSKGKHVHPRVYAAIDTLREPGYESDPVFKRPERP